ncbi:hypothetical protein Tco_0639998 [Tanacetum coccineum]
MLSCSLYRNVLKQTTRPNRYPVDTILIHIESRKSPTAELSEVDSGRISIHHCRMLKSITMNVLAESQG